MADLLSTGISGVRTYQRALATVGNNIANVDTEGYNRQRIEISENTSSNEGSLNIGNGARAVRVQRSYDSFVVENLRSSQSQLSKHASTLEYVTQLENILADKQLSLSSSLDGFFSAVQEVSLSPSSVAARQNMLNVAKATVSQFSSVGTQLTRIEEDSYNDMKGKVNALNQFAGQLARINSSLNRVNNIDKQPGELLDRRDTLIKDMSKLLRVTAVEKVNGVVDVHIGDVASGQYLVQGTKGSSLGVQRSTTNADEATLVLNPHMSPEKVHQLLGGSITGISEFRQNSLTTLRDELDTLAQVFVGEVNKVHALGINAHGTFGGELFSLGNVYSVTPGLNTGSGFVTVSAVPDAKIEKLTMALSYSDSTKNWTLTDTASETTVSGTSELTMGGIKVTLTGVPKDGDTFSLKSNKRPIDALQVSVTNHLNIAAGGAVSVARASTNTSISRVILNSYSKPAAAVADTSMDTALRNNISQVAASTITPSTNLAFVIPANTQNSQFYSTDSGSAAALEVDTITLSAAVASSGSVSYTYAGTTYTKAFDTDAATTMSGLVAAINAGAAGSTVTAAAVSGTVFTITKDAGSGTQMTKGTIGGTTNGSTELTITTADTTAGVDNTVQMQVFTREGKQIYGSALNSSEQSSLLTTANGFSTNAAYDSTYNNQTGSNAYMDANVTVTNPTSGDTRDYFAMAGSLKEDLLVFVTGTGSAEVSGQWGSLATVDLRDQLRQNIDVQFAADASTYVLKDVTTNTNIASGTFTAGSTIEHNGWKVSFDGVIKANDKFSIRGNTYQAGDNRNLLNIIDLQGNKDIFSGRGDFTEVYTDVIGNLGNSVVQSAVSRDAQQIIFDQAQAKRDETSAVSLDEEAADLLRFQQAYQASAQIISTANKLFDTILGIG